MVKHDHTIKIILLILGDIVMLYAALLGALFLRYLPQQNWILINEHFAPFTALFPLWLIFFGAFGLYDLRFMKNSKLFLYRLLRTMATNTVLTILILYLLPPAEIEPRRNLFLIVLAVTFLIFIWRYFFNILIIRSPASRVLFLGVNRDVLELSDYLIKNPQLGQRPSAFMTSNGRELSVPISLPYFTSPADLTHIIRDLDIDTVVISTEIKENKTLVKMLLEIIPLGIYIIEFPTFYETLTGKIPLSLIGEIWFLENLIGIKKNFYAFFKRGVDFIFSLALGVAALALSPFIVLWIKIDSPGPTFFKQKRVGQNGQIFNLIKFRSTFRMSVDSKVGWDKEDDRIYTRSGMFLRRSYLDEIPQIINILKGEMTLVGPRPERPEFVESLKKEVPFYDMRLLVPPGITGWAQINMENDAAAQDAPEKMQYDLYYIKNRSPVLDLLIMLRTFFTLLRREGR